jgi:hypothetical protein
MLLNLPFMTAPRPISYDEIVFELATYFPESVFL